LQNELQPGKNFQVRADSPPSAKPQARPQVPLSQALAVGILPNRQGLTFPFASMARIILPADRPRAPDDFAGAPPGRTHDKNGASRIAGPAPPNL
jgi:hypothetical protein